MLVMIIPSNDGGRYAVGRACFEFHRDGKAEAIQICDTEDVVDSAMSCVPEQRHDQHFIHFSRNFSGILCSRAVVLI
jgi:hypothetical protein